MDMDLKKLRQLVVVARVGSISRAAEELHITQPALSRSIAALEDRFGIRIFDRGRGGAQLTAVGKLAVAEAEDLLRRARSLEHNLRLFGRGEAGKIAFGMGPLIASLVLPDLSQYLLHSRPKLHTRASVKAGAVLIQELLDDQIEMLFCASRQLEPSPDLSLESVGRVSVAMMVRAEHSLAARETVTQWDIAAFPLLSGAELSATGLSGSEGAFICDNYQILRDAVLNSDGVWMSSPQLVVADIQSGRLKQLVVSDTIRPPAVEVAMVRRAGNTPSPAAVAITDRVRAFFAGLD